MEIKRNARAKVIFDYDDLLFLKQLNKKTNLNFNELKKGLNISHNSFLLHLRRLESYELVLTHEVDDIRIRFQGMPIKSVSLTKKGKDFLSSLLNIKKIV